MTVGEFIRILSEKGIHLTDNQIQQFNLYYQYLIEWNNRINLTAVTERDQVYLKHFYDSLMPLWMVEDIVTFKNQVLIDVGSGAGFPSIPLLIVEPTLKATILDSLNKRIDFINHLVDALGLSDRVTTIHGRAEEVAQNKSYRGQFNLATARAVAALNVLSEYCLPFVKKGGFFLALKGQKANIEVEEAEVAIKTLGAQLIAIKEESFPGDEGQRAVVVIKKTLETPKKYPRRPGKPSKQPITS